MNRRTNKRGFTLIEIMVVVLIIAMLGVFVAPKVFKRFGKAKVNLARAGIAQIEQKLEEFAYDCDRYPTQEEGLQALVSQEAASELEEGKWDGPYLKEKQLLDPWGRPYVYVAEGTLNEGSFDLICYGADGEPGGEGINADITNE